MEENNLEKLMKTISRIDGLFIGFNDKHIASLTNYQIVSSCYLVGGLVVDFEGLIPFKELPDYEKAVSRLEIIKNKLYKEAQRRDEEEGR